MATLKRQKADGSWEFVNVVNNDIVGRIDTVETEVSQHLADDNAIKHKAKTIALEDTANKFTATNVEGAMNELFTNVSNGKQLIATAITGKEIPTSSSDTFTQMASNISSIKVGAYSVGDKVLAPKLLGDLGGQFPSFKASQHFSGNGKLYDFRDGSFVIEATTTYQFYKSNRLIWALPKLYPALASFDKIGGFVYSLSNGVITKYSETTGVVDKTVPIPTAYSTSPYRLERLFVFLDSLGNEIFIVQVIYDGGTHYMYILNNLGVRQTTISGFGYSPIPLNGFHIDREKMILIYGYETKLWVINFNSSTYKTISGSYSRFYTALGDFIYHTKINASKIYKSSILAPDIPIWEITSGTTSIIYFYSLSTGEIVATINSAQYALDAVTGAITLLEYPLTPSPGTNGTVNFNGLDYLMDKVTQSSDNYYINTTYYNLKIGGY